MSTAEEPLLGGRREPFRAHAFAVVLLALAALLRFWPSVTAAGPLPDEMGYVRGIERVLAGGSPYPGGSYLYPPLVAHAGAWGWEHLGRGAVLAAFRLANLLGLATVVWCAAVWLPWGWRARVAAGAAYLAVAPAVRMGMLWGNLSLAVAGMIALALFIWVRRPWAAGALLGASIAVKPVAPVAVAVLAAHRPRRGGWRHWQTAATAAWVAAALIVFFPTWRELLAPLATPGLVARTVSVHRLAHLFGLDGRMIWVTATVALIAVAVARLRPLSPPVLFGTAVAATLAATPSVWPHTLLVSLPLQVMALRLAAERASAAAPRELRWRRWELVAVALAVAALQLSEGASSTDDRSVAFQIFSVLPPLLAPAALAAYVARFRLPGRAPGLAAQQRRDEGQPGPRR